MYRKKDRLFKLTGSKIFYFIFGLRMSISLIAASLLYTKYDNILNPLLNICNVLVLTLLVLIITIFQAYRMKEIVIIGILSIIFQIAAFKSGEGFIILSWLFICASKNIDLKIVAKETIFISVFILLMLTGLTGLGVIELSIMSRMDGVLRYSIGYANANQLGFIVLQLIVALTIKKNKNYTLFNFLILFLVFLFTYTILNCRSVSICICLLGGFDILFRGQCSNRLKYIGILVTILVPICSLYLSIIYNSQNSWLYNFDYMLSGRIELANKYIDNYGFSLMGYSLELTMLGALDNAYVRAAVFYGLVPLCIYVYGVVQLFMSEDNSRKIELICVMVMIVYGLMESMIFTINCNFTLLILANILYKKHNIYWEKLFKSKKIFGEIYEAFL